MINKKIYGVVLLLIFSLTGYTQKQVRISGCVQSEKQMPISYASVYLKEENRTLQTQSDGTFSLYARTYPGKEIELTIGALGYKTKLFRFICIEDRYEIFVLEKDTFALSEVIVHGYNEKTLQLKSSQSIVQIDNAYIEKNFSGSLMQSLAKIPGVKAMNIGSGESKPTIRGLGFNRILVTENGIKHDGQQWAEDHGLEIDQFSIDKVEVIKGPGTLLYGSDAIGGVINLSTNTIPEKDFSGRVNLFYRSNNQSFGVTSQIAGKSKKFYYKVHFSLSDYADYTVPADSIQYYSYYIKLKDRKLRNTAGEEYSGGFLLGYQGKKWQSFFQMSDVYAKSGFFANAHGIEIQLSNIDYDTFSRDIDLPYHTVNHLKIMNNTCWQIGALHFDGKFAYQNNVRLELAEPVSHGYMPLPPDSLERAFYKNIWTGMVAGNCFLGGKHSLNFGLSVDYQMNRISGWGFIIPEFNLFSSGAFLFDRFYITRSLILSTGVRYDFSKIHIFKYQDWYRSPLESGESVYKVRSEEIARTFNSFIWSLGLNYIYKSFQLKINLGKGFRIPIAKELGANGVNYHIFRYEQGNANLSPEESYQLDLGILWNNKWVNIQFSPYFNYFPNYIYLNPTANYYEGLQIYLYTQCCVIRTGFEMEAVFKYAKYFESTVKMEYLYAEQLTGDKKGYTLPFSPPFSSNFEIKYLPRAQWSGKDGFISISLNVVGAQNRIVPPETATFGHQTVDIALGRAFQFKKCSLKCSLQAQNIFNCKYYDHTSYYRLIDVPEPGVNFSVMIGVNF